MTLLRTLLFACVLLAFAPDARAQTGGDLATGITEETVSVTSDYRGARLIVFGVHIRRGRAQSDVVILLRGPPKPAIVRRKRQIAGLWINADPVRFHSAPSFYALASTRPIGSFLAPNTISQLGLDPGALARLEGSTPRDADAATYRRALVRLMKAEGLYRESPRGLTLEDDGAFKAPFIIPANAPVGSYSVDVYLFRGGRLVQHEPGAVVISRIGVEEAIYSSAQNRPLLYGFAAVVLAVCAGWIAALVFRRS